MLTRDGLRFVTIDFDQEKDEFKIQLKEEDYLSKKSFYLDDAQMDETSDNKIVVSNLSDKQISLIDREKKEIKKVFPCAFFKTLQSK